MASEPRKFTADNPEALITEAQAAGRLNLSQRTLQAWRRRGEGPAYVRAGRAIRYRRTDLDEWINAQLVLPRPESGRGLAVALDGGDRDPVHHPCSP